MVHARGTLGDEPSVRWSSAKYTKRLLVAVKAALEKKSLHVSVSKPPAAERKANSCQRRKELGGGCLAQDSMGILF